MTWAAPLGLLGLLAVPAVLVLHLFRRRLQQRRVAGLFLWTGERLIAAAGRKRTRLLQSWPLWLEMLAAAVAALWLAGPTFRGRTARHLVAVLDDSASMAAVASGSAAQQRALEQLAHEVRRLSPGDRLTVVQSGPRPKVALGPAAPPGEFDRATLPYRPAQPDHDLGPALDLAAELAGADGEVWLGTDRLRPGCADTVTLCAVGRPAPNAALVSCRRWSQPGGVRVAVSIAGHGGIGSATLRVLAADRPLLRRQVDLGREPVLVTFDLPADTGELDLELGDDALMIDNRAWLLPPPRRVVGICDALPAPLRQGLQIGRVLAALPDWRSQPDPQQAQLRFSAAPGRLSGGQIELVFRGGDEAALPDSTAQRDGTAQRDAWPGPFLFDSGSPLLDGVRLQGVVWVARRTPPAEPLPGRMLIAAGSKTLCSEQEEALGRRIWFDLDPNVGNVVRAPDWPILMANLLEAARAEVPGPERQDLVLGQEARYRRSMLAGGGGQLQLLAPDGQRSPGRGARTLAWLPLQAGRHSVRDTDDREVAAFAVQFVDPAESDLAAAATATVAAARLVAGHRGAAVDGAFERRLLALLLLLLIVGDWWVLQREVGVIRWLHPEVFLLLPLLVLVLRRRLWPRPLLGVLRGLLLLLLVALLAQPYRIAVADGRDIVVVLDRSRSMPAAASAAAQEYLAEVQARLQPGDRLGLVTFGRKAMVEEPPSPAFHWQEPVRAIDADGSDLAAAITAATALIAPGRQGSLLLWSDGEANGPDPEPAARAVLRAGLRLDAMATRRSPGADVAVIDLSAPTNVPVGAPFVLTAQVQSDQVQSDQPRAVPWQLLCDGRKVGEGSALLQPGRNVLQFRQAAGTGGVHTYALELVAGDPVPQNDRGLCALRADAAPVVLCVTPDGRQDRLTRSLAAAGHNVETVAAGSAPLSLDQLDAVRCVVLENVPAQDLPAGAMQALATWVRELGGGLLMTGGEASFGVGGYHRSPVETVLPVTMEMRDEQRRFALAMAIALDRSGSMAAAAGDVTKMDLANRGAAAAVELLSRLDGVSVLAVDSAAHVVVPMQNLDDKPGVIARIRSIDSGGGGIYVGAALKAAARQLAAGKQQRKHLVLFADAADAEEPEDYLTFVPALAKAGVTVSVIGLGQKSDPDAALLEEVAKLGNGRCQFVAEPSELPRVFAQETIAVARSAMVEEPAAVLPLPALGLLGEMPAPLPEVGGYSLAWRRDTAELAVVTVDEQKAPLLSYWQCGLGRGAAFLGEADGKFSGKWSGFAGYGAFFSTLVRWLGGGVEPGVWTDFRRQGDQGLLSVEVEERLAAALDDARGVVSGPDGVASDLRWERVGPGRLQAVVAMAQAGLYRAAVQVAGSSVRVPPLCLPYSPEFAPQLDPERGERLLRHLCLLTGGQLDPSADAVVQGERRAPGRVDLGELCALVALGLLLVEIAVRRFDLQLPAWRWRRRAAPAAASAPAAVPAPLPAASAPPPAAKPAAAAGKRVTEDSTLAALARAQQKRRS